MNQGLWTDAMLEQAELDLRGCGPGPGKQPALEWIATLCEARAVILELTNPKALAFDASHGNEFDPRAIRARRILRALGKTP
jgi:hypothetical protein